MGGKHSRSQRRQSSASQSQRSIPSRSSSDHSFQRIWSRTSRRRRSVVSLTDPYLASRTTWPVPQSEAMFLPEYEVNPRSAEQEYKILHQINKGAYGQVLKVQRKEDGENYAMKVLSKLEVIRSEAIKQCKEEVSIQNHSNNHQVVNDHHNHHLHERHQLQHSNSLTSRFIPRLDREWRSKSMPEDLREPVATAPLSSSFPRRGQSESSSGGSDGDEAQVPDPFPELGGCSPRWKTTLGSAVGVFQGSWNLLQFAHKSSSSFCPVPLYYRQL
eukprot:XP_011667178.1 PREDICTED: serine/threonine-protein kinase CBK1 [Strongylocentrotus purpuratus]